MAAEKKTKRDKKKVLNTNDYSHYHTPTPPHPHTINTASLITPVETVEGFIALLDAVDAGAVSTLELIRPARQESC